MSNTVFSRRDFLGTAGTIAAGAVIAGETFAQEVPKKPKIKIGQIGTGHMHASKFGVLHKLPDLFEVVGIADDDPNQRSRHENKGIYKDVPWMSVEELLAYPGLQAVAVEVEEHHPLPVALKCVKAGKHVHIDKPAGESLKDFKEILDIAKAKNLTVQMGYMYRTNPALEFCFKAVRDGLLGDIYDVDAVMNRYDTQGFRNIIKTFRGGTPFIFSCHMIDMVVTILGAPTKIHPFNRRTREDGVLDNSVAVFEYPKDVIATVRTSINEVEGFQKRYLTVRGSKGTIVIQPLESQGNMSGGVLQLALTKDEGGFKKGYQTVEMPPLKDRYEGQWVEFADVINGDIVNLYTYEHDYIVQKCLLEVCEML
ncbi:MAG: Gfo/Idh/MocA family oxidoreductase [Planctomycetaceae bacterium]|nr:Gfo/Idh/MocA family oxidoreductase [Planctomycetaceae bacterium]